MISKRGKGRQNASKWGFADLARYIHKHGSAAYMEATNFHLIDPEGDLDLAMAIAEAQAIQALNKRAETDKTYHLIVSFPQGEQPGQHILRDIERHLVEKLGLEEHQRISALHTDTDNWHLHVAINLVHPETYRKITPYADQLKLSEACRDMELKWELHRDNGLHFIDGEGNILRTSEKTRKRGADEKAKQIEAHQGIESFATWLEKEPTIALKAALGRQDCTWEALHEKLASMNLEIVPHGNGLAVRDRDNPKQAAKASALGRAFSKSALEKRLGPYAPATAKAKAAQASTRYTERPIQAAQSARREQQHQLYQQWKAERGQRDQAKAEAWKAQRASEKKRRQATNDHAKKRREQAKAGPGTTAEKRAKYKLIAMDRVLDQQKLTEAFKHERATLRDEYGKAETYRDYLQREAQQGNETALAGLRDVSKAQERPEPAKADAFRPGQDFGNEAQPAKLAREFKGQAVAYQVHKNGDVSYRLAGRDALRDTGRRIEVHQGTDRATVELGLRLARARFGQTVNANGSEAFKRMAVEIAVEQRMDVKFSDPALEAYRRQLEKDRDAAKRLPSPAERLAKVDTERRAKPVAPRQAAKREPAPTPADRLKDKSRAEAEAWAKDTGYAVVPANKAQGRYSGEILWQSETHYVQSIGRNEAVIHSRGDLEKAYKRGQAATIQYQDGKGREIDGPEHAPGRGRGLPGPGRNRNNDRER